MLASESRVTKASTQYKEDIFPADMAKLTSPQTLADNRWVGLVRILCITMFDISKIRPKYILSPVKAPKFSTCLLTSIGNPIVEIRWSYGCLISKMGFLILVRWHLYIESGPGLHTTISRLLILLIEMEPSPLKHDHQLPLKVTPGTAPK